MNVKNPELVLVKGVDDFCANNLCHLFDLFHESTAHIPKEDAYYVAMYKNRLLPDALITHIGIVSEIAKHEFGHDYYYKAIIDLKKSIMPKHPLKPVEYWKLSDIGLNRTDMDKLRKQLDLV